ncbi:uncharacterized protein LOC127281803 isoform X2 [Leptopilina boulardi]|uniref:uncharacterized protein LOC127281803 isoform X2 n=1 Tax=Leptopilina boulardi TaxID=63433 RepID=UPI0021F691FA|nr:uncharacterized protein LOC127281803 isoform X2 [Leptopilina boulardi]
MATPSELSLEEIRKYLLENGGSVRNHDLVKYFKKFLTDPETRVEARNRFKEYVNILATIKNEEGEKYLMLKKKYRQTSLDLSSPSFSFGISPTSPVRTPEVATPVSPLREPPPYRPPPPAPLSPASYTTSPVSRYQNEFSDEATGGIFHNQLERNTKETSAFKQFTDESPDLPTSPPVPPRRKSQDKVKVENKENVSVEKPKTVAEIIIKGTEEDDRASVASQLDGKSREWLVRAAQGDYQALAKLAAEEPRLTRMKDPSSVSI